jgi:hypothetical protein
VEGSRAQKERFYQFLWRPRAPSLLTKEQEDEIRQNLKKYSRVYEEEDLKVGDEVRLASGCFPSFSSCLFFASSHVAGFIAYLRFNNANKNSKKNCCICLNNDH